MLRKKRLLRQTYWWPNIDLQVEDMVRYCKGCQRSKKSQPAISVPETQIPALQKPGKQYAIDISRDYDRRFLVVLIDCFSRFPEILVTKDTTSAWIIQWFKGNFVRYGYPDGLISNNGPQFIFREFEGFLHGSSSLPDPSIQSAREWSGRVLQQGTETWEPSFSGGQDRLG